jgi:hypothetical protein
MTGVGGTVGGADDGVALPQATSSADETARPAAIRAR